MVSQLWHTSFRPCSHLSNVSLGLQWHTCSQWCSYGVLLGGTAHPSLRGLYLRGKLRACTRAARRWRPNSVRYLCCSCFLLWPAKAGPHTGSPTMRAHLPIPCLATAKLRAMSCSSLQAIGTAAINQISTPLRERVSDWILSSAAPSQ